MYIASKFNSERISLVDIGVASTPTFYPGSPGLGDSLYPNFGNGGYDVQKYTINLDISDPLISTLAGVTIIEATTTQALSSFNLDLIGFDVASIVINDEPATFTREGQELIITPTAPLAEGEAFTASITYSGSPEQINSVAFFWPTPVGWVIFDGGSFVRSQPEGAATYYPVNDHPLDLATYTFQVTVPSEFEVAANGVLEQTINNGDTTTYVFEARDPMASYLSTVNIAEGFKLDTSVSDSGVLIRNYFSETIPDEQLSAFDLQPKMIDFLSSIIGPYPFEVYGSVVLDTEITVGAMESQTLSLFGTEALNADIPLEEIIVHEAAHQWFGNALPLGDWSDIWLNEGFATYAQGLWVEYTQGAEALDAWVKNTYGSLRTSFFAESPGDPPAGNLFNDGVYGWGALALHDLRIEVGDDAFFEIVRTYFDTNRGRNVVTEDLITVAEEVSDRPLVSFFDRWIYNDFPAPIPELGLKYRDTIIVGDETANLLEGPDNVFDEIYAGGGDDTVSGGLGGDIIYGEFGNDILRGDLNNNSPQNEAYGNDWIYGGAGDDLIGGKGGNDRLYGDEGNDRIWGDQGDDLLWGGLGHDELFGGEGADTFVLSLGQGLDIIRDFGVGNDVLGLADGLTFEDLSFTIVGNHTQISVSEQVLARIRNFTTALSSSDFVPIV